MTSTKKQRVSALKAIEAYLRTGIVKDNQDHILTAHQLVADLMSYEGIFILSDKPKFPEKD